MIKKIVAILILTLSILNAQESNATKEPKFILKDIYGKTTTVYGLKNGLKIPDAKGKVVLIEFWGTHCPPCLMSIPHYIDLTKKYKDKLAIYAIEVQATPKDRLLEFAKQKGINYNIFTQDENINFVRYLAQRAGWRGAIPFLVIFDQSGNVVDMKIGMVSEKYLEQVIDFLNSDKYKNQNKSSSKTKDTNSTKADNNSSKK